MGKPIAPMPDVEYIGLDLTLIRCMETSDICTFEIIRRIGMIQMYQNDTNVSGMMQVTRLLRLRLRLR